jgi:16S rRNA (cytidine1402-2'-O)-methyltransferase
MEKTRGRKKKIKSEAFSSEEGGRLPKGVLLVVSTPIGNMEDITLRAISTLKEVDVIAAEDTRTTRKLLSVYGIRTRLINYIEQGAKGKGYRIVDLLKRGKKVALVTEAGTPGISDPGYGLVELCIAHSIPIVPIPGASALTAALSISGLPTDRFLFLGFLPNRSQSRRRYLEAIEREQRTLVFFEAPRRLCSSLKDILEVLGNRKASICRELTKMFEEVQRGSIAELVDLFDNRAVRGEFTLVIDGCKKKDFNSEKDVHRYTKRIQFLRDRCGLSERDIVRVVAEEEGISRKRVYQWIVEEKKRSEELTQ